MAINKINPSIASQPVSGTKNTQPSRGSEQAHKVYKSDVVDVKAQTAHIDKAAYAKAMDIISKTPDVRAEKIAELQKNPSSYTKPSSEILEAVAKKLLKDFLG